VIRERLATRRQSALTDEAGTRPTLRETSRAYLYLGPALIIISVFTIFPLIMAFRMGFYESYNFFTDVGTGFGFKSFQRVLTDSSFHIGVRNTLILALVAMPISLLLSLVIAVLLNNRIVLRGLYQTIYFLPYVTSVIAVGIVFRWLFHSNYGLINYMLGLIGMRPVAWLNEPDSAVYALSIYYVWSGLAFKTIVFLAGLQNIDPFYYRAARVDGAKPVKIFFRITIPLLSPTIMFLTVVSLIDAFKTYNEVYALFGDLGGPAESAMTVVFYIYRTFYGSGRMHIAAAAAVLLFLFILVVTLVQLWASRKLVHYR
jgi:multiple sugar transport system permease protein